MRILAAGLLGSALFFGTAQAADRPSDAQCFGADYFTRFNPSNAYDMVTRVPGFRIQDGVTRRGFAGTAGNVLIDGAAPNSKGQTLEDQLKRIPARQVNRIEMLTDPDGASGGMGQSLRVNIVRVPLAASGVWSVGTELANTGQPAPNGYGAVSGRAGGTDYAFGGSLYSLRRNLNGDRMTSGGGGVLGTAIDRSPRAYVQYSLNGELSHALLGGKLRGRASTRHTLYADRSQTDYAGPDGAPRSIGLTPYRESNDDSETGLEFERSVGKGTWKLAALSSRKRFGSTIVSTTLGPDGTLWARFAQGQTRDAREDILRAAYSRDWGRGHRFEAGMETAKNSLDARTDMSLDLGSGPSPLYVPNANIRIHEDRAELHAGNAWALRPGWTLETRLAQEVSRLAFSGDTTSRVSFNYLKPSVQLNLQAGAHRLRLKLARDVSQLDFVDFTSTQSFADGRINGGNPELKPQTTWRLELGAETRFGKDGALTLRFYKDRIADAADLIPVTRDGLTYDAPGNIGDAEVTGVQAIARIPLGKTVPGGYLDLDAHLRDSSVRDPSTGDTRPLSLLSPWVIQAGFRQDVPQSPYAWGVSYAGEGPVRRYYFGEVDIRQSSASLDAFGEMKLGKAMKLQLSARSLLNDPETRARTFYAAPRPSAIDHVESRRAFPQHWLYATLSGWF